MQPLSHEEGEQLCGARAGSCLSGARGGGQRRGIRSERTEVMILPNDPTHLRVFVSRRAEQLRLFCVSINDQDRTKLFGICQKHFTRNLLALLHISGGAPLLAAQSISTRGNRRFGRNCICLVLLGRLLEVKSGLEISRDTQPEAHVEVLNA